MLDEISIGNFKSYKEASLKLASLTFLIGANASGKSNALEAIRLLNWLAKGSRLDDILKSIQGADTVIRGQALDLFNDEASPFRIGCVLSNMPDNWSTLQLEVHLLADQLIVAKEAVWKDNISRGLPLYSIDSPPNPHTDEVSVQYNNFKKGGNKPHIPCSNRQAIFYQLESPSRFAKSDGVSQQTIPKVTKQLREHLRCISFLDPRPSAMRDYSYVKDNELKENGSNLSSVLYKICQQGPEREEQLLNFVRFLPEQNIAGIDFIVTERKDVMVRLRESFGNVDGFIDAPLLSDGTLRVLAIAALLMTAPEGAFVVIEEIDNGVHPSRADGIVKQIQRISEHRNLRVLVTTHNPAILDALPDQALEHVLCCYRDPIEGDSRVTRLGDLEDYPELVAQASLGELVTNKTLERVLKNRMPKDERIQQSLKWLSKLKSEAGE